MTTAATQIANVVVPAVWVPYMVQQSLTLSRLYQSGIIEADGQLSSIAQGGGKTYDLPYWADIGGTSKVGSDDPDANITPDIVTAGQDVAIKHIRTQAWSTMDLAGVLAGSDPAKLIADRVAAWWTRDMQAILIAALKGVIADNVANDSGDMVLNIATDANSAVTSAEKISATAILAAKQTMGDAAEGLTALVMHSVVYTELQRQSLISFIPNDKANVGFGTYMGYSVIIDDSCPAVAGTYRITYTTYLFGRGAVAYADAGPAPGKAVAIQRNELAGNGTGLETLVSRRHFILHPRGIKFVPGGVAGVSPTNSELAAAAQWDRVYARKAIKLVAIKTNG